MFAIKGTVWKTSRKKESLNFQSGRGVQSTRVLAQYNKNDLQIERVVGMEK